MRGRGHPTRRPRLPWIGGLVNAHTSTNITSGEELTSLAELDARDGVHCNVAKLAGEEVVPANKTTNSP